MFKRIAVLIDGDNISADHAAAIMTISKAQGQVDVARVYGNAQLASGWHTAPGFRFLHAGTGKNATDILLVIDAMELALQGGIEAFVLASSDRDFSHLAQRLKEKGLPVIGIGEAKTPASYRATCTAFHQIGEPAVKAAPATVSPPPPLSKIDQRIREVIKKHGNGNDGLGLAAINNLMPKDDPTKISTLPEKTWRGYFTVRPTLYDLDPRGPDAKVRLRAKGIAESRLS